MSKRQSKAAPQKAKQSSAFMAMNAGFEGDRIYLQCANTLWLGDCLITFDNPVL
jgi:hypothetical protein